MKLLSKEKLVDVDAEENNLIKIAQSIWNNKVILKAKILNLKISSNLESLQIGLIIKLVNFKEVIEKIIITRITDIKFTKSINSFVNSHNFIPMIQSNLDCSDKNDHGINLALKVLELRLYILLRDKVDASKKILST